MEKDSLEEVDIVAYWFLEKACSQANEISYRKLQCLIYQTNKSYYHYTNRLLYDINTITSDRYPINKDILEEFFLSRDSQYISYTVGSRNTLLPLEKTIFLDYIWSKYAAIRDEELINEILDDKVFSDTSGVDITEDNFKNEKEDVEARNFMDFLLK